MQLRDYQKESVDACIDWFCQGKDRPLIVLPTGCHAAGTKVIMYDGSLKKVEDVSIGDLLMGDDSTPRIVLNLARGKEMMYQINPKKGNSFIVNENHILSLKATRERKPHPSNTKGNEIQNISVKDYIGKSKYWKHLYKLYAVPINFPKKNTPLEIDPWVLGCFLGDGSTANRSVSITGPDREVMDGVAEYCEKTYGVKRRKQIKPHNKAWTYYFPDHTQKGNKLTDAFVSLGLMGKGSGDRFVPFHYKTGTRDVRLNILAGLIDTDGHFTCNCYDWISKSKKLANDFCFIARSLGYKAILNKCKKGNQYGFVGKYYRVSLSGDFSDLPCRVERKKSKPRKQKKNVLKTGFDICPLGVDCFYGFELDGNHLYLTEDFIVHHNTGKSVVAAEICRDVLEHTPHARVVVAAHVKELVKQNYQKMKAIWPHAPAGIVSAGLNRREYKSPILFGGIQSMYRRAADIGHVDLLLCDEAHCIPHKGQGMWLSFIEDLHAINPKLRVAGMTATPYRTTTGTLVGGSNPQFDGICYEYSIVKAIKEGYLSEIISRPTETYLSTAGVHKRGGEFIAGELEKAVNVDSLTKACCDEIISLGEDRKTWLIFASGNSHAHRIHEYLKSQNLTGHVLTQETSLEERSSAVSQLVGGQCRYIVNNMILTTGFDCPRLDLIACMRPTGSPGLWAQMCGRGTRLFPGKENCLLLDFGRNIDRHGPIDEITGSEWFEKKEKGDAPIKNCPKCFSVIHAAARICPECEYEFPVNDLDLTKVASGGALLSYQNKQPKLVAVLNIQKKRHKGREGKPDTLRVDYTTLAGSVSEFLCYDHPEDSWAYQKACNQWGHYSSVEAALSEAWITPKSIKIQKEGKYFKVLQKFFE